eukprot:7701430-Lingulodinium_polyedra.AAC.1
MWRAGPWSAGRYPRAMSRSRGASRVPPGPSATSVAPPRAPASAWTAGPTWPLPSAPGPRA